MISVPLLYGITKLVDIEHEHRKRNRIVNPDVLFMYERVNIVDPDVLCNHVDNTYRVFANEIVQGGNKYFDIRSSKFKIKYNLSNGADIYVSSRLMKLDVPHEDPRIYLRYNSATLHLPDSLDGRLDKGEIPEFLKPGY